MERSREFREGLVRELPVWQAEGILTPGAARALAARYDLDEASSAPARGDRTGPLAAAAGLGVAATLAAALLGMRDGVLLPLVALSAAFAAAPLVSRGEVFAPAASALRGVGRGLFYVTAWALSFVAVADAVRFQGGLSPGLLAAVPAFLLAAFAVVAGLRRTDVEPHARGEAMLLAATVLAIAAGLGLEEGAGAAVVANLALLFLGVGRVVRGLSWLARGPFWEGLLVAAVLVASRLLDVVHGPWPRAGSVAAVAALTLGAGVAFERRRARAPSAAGAPAT